MKIGILAAAALALAAPAFAGRPLTSDQIGQFKVGATTQSDLVKALGKPMLATSRSDGTALLTYGSVSAHPKAATFIPIVGMFAGGAKGSSQAVVFTFGKDGLLAGVDRSESNIDCSLGVGGGHC